MAGREKQSAGNRIGGLYACIRRLKRELVTAKQDVDINSTNRGLIAGLAHTRQELHESRGAELSALQLVDVVQADLRGLEGERSELTEALEELEGVHSTVSEDLNAKVQRLRAEYERYIVESEKTIYDLTQQLISTDAARKEEISTLQNRIKDLTTQVESCKASQQHLQEMHTAAAQASAPDEPSHTVARPRWSGLFQYRAHWAILLLSITLFVCVLMNRAPNQSPTAAVVEETKPPPSIPTQYPYTQWENTALYSRAFWSLVERVQGSPVERVQRQPPPQETPESTPNTIPEPEQLTSQYNLIGLSSADSIFGMDVLVPIALRQSSIAAVVLLFLWIYDCCTKWVFGDPSL